MFRDAGGRPNDVRGFLHKSFIGKAFGTVLKATPVGRIASTAINLIKPKARPTLSPGQPARLRVEDAKRIGRAAKFPELATTGRIPDVGFGGNGNGQCPPGTVACEGNCVSPKSDFGKRCLGIGNGGTGRFPAGDAVMGQFGAALEPTTMTIERRVCRPGMQLAMDGLCYNKGSISNSQREWPRGRRPLLTGGDMRAIGVAARAGAKLDRTTKRLRSLGMMKKLPAPRKAPAHQHAKALPAVSIS